jgi:hypothetical protein
VPFRPTSVTVYPGIQPKFDEIERLAIKGRQPAQSIWKGVRTAVARIKADGQWGEVIPARSIPKIYGKELGVTNLYCVDLPAFYRLFYTIMHRDVIIIDLVDHRQYDRLMAY